MSERNEGRGRKPKLLCDHDIAEILMFQRYLDDAASLPKEEFYPKWQEYLGLSDTELAAILRRIAND